MSLYGTSHGNLVALPLLVVGLRVVAVFAWREEILQRVAAVSALTLHLDVIGAFAGIGDRERVVCLGIPSRGFAAGIIIVAGFIPAYIHPVYRQFVGLVEVIDEIDAAVARHFDLVPVVVVHIVRGIAETQMSLYGLSDGYLGAFSLVVVGLSVFFEAAGSEGVLQRVATVS